MNSNSDSCPKRALPPTRYFLSEELIWRILKELYIYCDGSLRTISRDEVKHFISDHTCRYCGRVFLSRVDLMSHHATTIFCGVEVIDPQEDVIDLDELFPSFGNDPNDIEGDPSCLVF
jgi:hypothetical protein